MDYSDDVQVVAAVVTAYVANNRMMAQDLAGFIFAVHQTVADLRQNGNSGSHEAPKPAVPIKKSVTDAYIVCLEDGLKFKSLKRHLRSSFDMTPEQYRAKWGLPHDYPMVAPAYAEHRSRLAKANGLGRKLAAGRRR